MWLDQHPAIRHCQVRDSVNTHNATYFLKVMPLFWQNAGVFYNVVGNDNIKNAVNKRE